MSTSHAAWNLDAVHGVHAMWSVRRRTSRHYDQTRSCPRPSPAPPRSPSWRQSCGAAASDDLLDVTELTRALYSSDASLYRVVPQAVAQPRTVEETAAVLEAARAVGMPVTTRGAGTSCAGNAVGPGLIVDTSRHLTTILEIDPEARTARVEPGVVQASLQAQLPRMACALGRIRRPTTAAPSAA